ncbi:hypothetical protein D3C75_710740 [compost metagenome]
MHGDTIGIRARFKLVSQTQLEIALMPKVRIVELADLFRTLFDQHALFEIEQVRRLFAGLFPPVIKVASRNDIVRNALVVKLKQRVVVHQYVAAAGLVLKFFNFIAQLEVVAEERMAGLPVAFN